MSLENIPYCDTFYPKAEELENFENYVELCERKAKSAIIKIVPPKKWKARKDNYTNLEFTIPSPIEQFVTGIGGLFEVVLIQREARTLTKYRKFVESFDKLTENKNPLQIEKMFWKNLKFSAPLYGADSPGSIFDKGVTWNLSELNSILKEGLDNGILGVTSPYLYFGAWKTLFAWHKEDMDLYSINYLHLGKAKYWYAVDLEDSQKFEDFMIKSFPDAFKDCKEFIRHKNFLIHPHLLLNNGIKLHKCVQNPGEFVITLAGGYHCGFNSGFNIAEAVNFALKRWIELGVKANSCRCRGDSVRIDMEKFINNVNEHKRKKKIAGRNSILNDSNRMVTVKCTKCGQWRKVSRDSSFKDRKKFECRLLKNLNCNSQTDESKKPKSQSILNEFQMNLGINKRLEIKKRKNVFNKSCRQTLRRKRRNRMSTNLVTHLQIKTR